jgi:hypothetical protein
VAWLRLPASFCLSLALANGQRPTSQPLNNNNNNLGIAPPLRFSIASADIVQAPDFQVLICFFPPLGSSGQRVASTFVTGEQRSHRQSVSRISTVQKQFRIPSYLFFFDFSNRFCDQIVLTNARNKMRFFWLGCFLFTLLSNSSNGGILRQTLGGKPHGVLIQIQPFKTVPEIIVYLDWELMRNQRHFPLPIAQQRPPRLRSQHSAGENLLKFLYFFYQNAFVLFRGSGRKKKYLSLLPF